MGETKFEEISVGRGEDLVTLTRWVISQQQDAPEATGDLTLLLAAIQFGCKFVASKVKQAGLINLLGLTGAANVQGEEVKKLDVLANDIFRNALIASGKACILISEEDENAMVIQDKNLRGKYIVTFDPLDGSSNIDCGVSIGTIFGIFKVDDSENPNEKDVLRSGRNLISAGYCMYGSYCEMILSVGNGVNGFTLDPAIGEFIMTHPNIKMPSRGKIYSVNEGNYKHFDEPCKKYVDQVKQKYSARYVGSMVSDIHRTLLYGGIFGYPADAKSKRGKLRILYEVFPMSFLIEQAGGKASTGTQNALDLIPEHIHDRSGIWLGSKEDVEELESFYKQ
ncbi:fructose-1,6-bisphosphatase [Phascolomyces articulosus]|uniref:Fructose-1,6-bisphosphatase n=1 Tax=Phascolomyces articulosus TaxID=60185 RepID=A0AAD5JTH9_9FUNG|nr:fructose-1,6-bisphosphatase [Phascolomyces articulosus]